MNEIREIYENGKKYYIINGVKHYQHHTSMHRGYVSVKSNGEVEKYNGRFGKGYKILKHNPDSTTYCICVYVIEVKECE